MAPAIPFIAKAVVGMAVSKVVGKITGNELLGALAGGFVGAGFSIDAATGAMSWSNPLSGILDSTAGTATTGVANAGVESASLLDDAAMNMVDDASLGMSSASNVAGGMPAPDVVSQYGFGPGGDLVKGGAETMASSGGMLSKAGNALTKGFEWADKNPKIAQMGFDFVQGALSPDKIDEIEASGEQDRLTLAQKQELEQKSKEAVDADALKGRLQAIGDNMFKDGYRSGGLLSQATGINPLYYNQVDPNYQNRVNAVYTLPKNEQEGKS